MKTDLIKYALQNLAHRRLRSYLTVLSILIGITAIFAIMSFGQGLIHYTNKMFEEMGTDKLMMMPKGAGIPGMGAVTFTEDDIDFFRKIKGVKEAAGMMMEVTSVTFKSQKKPSYAFAAGMPTSGDEQRLVTDMFGGIGIMKGRNIKKGDKLKAALGYNYQFDNKILKEAVEVGDKITVKDVQVEVVGFYEEIGNPGDDSNIYLSFEGFNEIFGKDDFGYVIASVSAGESPAIVAERANEKFRKRFNQKEGQEDFYIQTFEEVIEQYNVVLLVLNGILALIALISVVVAGVNIANTMYTSVLERTKEIGIMKAIGSKNWDIMVVFIIESGTLGMVGGIMGIIIGWLVAKAGGWATSAAGVSMLQPYFPVWLILGCAFFAFIVGAGAGIFPALQAARQKPVDALRYE